MSLLIENLSLLLLIWNFNFIGAQSGHSLESLDTSKSEIEWLPGGGISIQLYDPKQFYENVRIKGTYSCNQNQITDIDEKLLYNFNTKSWEYVNSLIPFCESEIKNFDYNIFENVKEENKPSILVRNARSPSPQLLGGVTKPILGNVKLELLGLEVENKGDDQNSNPNSQGTQSVISTTEPPAPVSNDCEFSKTTINNGKKVCKNEIIFEDDFKELNWSEWSYDIRIPLDSDDNDFVSFQNQQQNLYVKNEILYILPNLLSETPSFSDGDIRSGVLDLGINCTATFDRNSECKREAYLNRILPPVVSARITTKNKFSFKYGEIEIRAKLPKGDWIFPQLFLEPSNHRYGISGYASGQIRIAFIRGNEFLNSKEGNQIDGYRLYGGVVLAQGEEFREIWMKNILRRRSHFGDDFHVFTTIWSDENLIFKIDGNEYGRLNGNFSYEAFNLHNVKHAEYWKVGNKVAPFDDDFHITLGVSAGGISDFPDGSSSGKRESDQKPWKNLDFKNELDFWKAKDWWHSTWVGEDAALKVDYIRVRAL